MAFRLTLLLMLLSGYYKAQVATSLHSYTALTIDGKVVNLADYSGKKIMLVNTASYCSYTPQFADLEQLYKAYKQYHFEILGFPCNDFGGQDPGKDSVISDFCTGNYGVSFTMMSKISITAPDTAPVYRWLQRGDLNGVKSTKVDWNFNKYLVNEAGQLVTHFTSTVSPLDPRIKNWILSPPVTRIQEHFDKKVLMLSSNPASGNVRLRVPGSANEPYFARIVSVEGKILNAADTRLNDNEETVIDVSMLQSGLYFIVISNGLDRTNLPLIIANY